MSRRDELLKVWTEHANIGYVPFGFTDVNFLRHPKCVNERPEGQDGYDWFGVHWTYEPMVGAPMITPNHPRVITDITKWEEQVKFPDLQSLDWETGAAEETNGWDRENKVSEVMLINGMFERSHHLMGFENVFIAMFEEPEAYQALIDRICEYKCELVRIVAKYYKPDILMMHDDYGANDRMLMSPAFFRQFFKEPLSRIVKTVHEGGIVYEHHSCGYVEPIIGDLIEIGVDALDCLQRPCNDIRRVKDQFGGKITLVDGFSNQTVLDRPESTLEEIYADIQYAYDVLAPGGGYVSFPLIVNGAHLIPKLIEKHMQICCNYK